ncbi:MAG TPA: PHB depolymerase family esterase [Burkholderiales bacterium]|nr:PHB depolymerase family esterase [Burkholderiales bacterium]
MRPAALAAAALLLALPVHAGRWTDGSHRSWKGFLVHAPLVWPSREYRLYLPDGIPEQQPAPLVVMLHGCKQDPDAFAAGTRMNRLADRHGFLVLYPRQSPLQNAQHCWNWFDAASQRGWGEAAIIAGMVEAVAKRHPVDRRRVYVAGLSAGGAMTSILAACHAGLFAAAAIHSGVAYKAAASPWTALSALEKGGGTPPAEAGRDAWKCSGAGRLAMPVIVIQGEADERVRPVNAGQIVEVFAQMNDLADDGRDNDSVNARATSARTEAVPGGRSYLVREYSAGGRTLIKEYRVQGMAHAWSGGDESQPYNDRFGPDASALIWEFFSRHTR